MVLRHTGHRPLAKPHGRLGAGLRPARRTSRAPAISWCSTPAPAMRQHVGFFAGWDHGRVLFVSGNWGHRVARASVYQGAVAAFIRV